jgi:hypothetical protein
MKCLILGFLCLILAIGSVYAADYSPKTHFYLVEYLKPTKGANTVSVVNLVFNRALDAQTAERLLREEIQRAITMFPPTGTVMAYAWTQTDPAPGSEKAVSLADGSGFLIFSPDFKRIQTEKEYDAAKVKPPEKGRGLHVQISAELEKGSDGRVRISATTNLPDGMALMLDLRGVGYAYFAQDKVEVAKGRFVSNWFSDKGRPLRRGTYEISISSPLPDLQPQQVRTVIGRKGENLEGPVKTWMGSKMVDLTFKKDLW